MTDPATALAGWFRDRLPDGRDLDQHELEALGGELAASPELWLPLVRHDPQSRVLVQLRRDHHIEAWLICWMPSQDVGLHDHDVSVGAVHVVDGAVAEERMVLGRGIETTEYPAGESFVFDPAMLRIGAEIAGLFLDAQRTTLAGLRVLDHRGVVIGGRDELGLSLAHVEEIAEAMQGRYASALRQRAPDSPTPPLASLSRGTGVQIFSAFPVVRGDRLLGIVYLSRTPNNILRHMYATRDRFLLAGAHQFSASPCCSAG